MIRVVLDANVLVSAALARDPAAPSVRAFDALLDERFEAVACPALLGEVASVLGRDRLRHYRSLGEARRFVTDLATPYIRPQENGGRADVRWLELRDGTGRTIRLWFDRPLQVSATHQRAADLAAATHDGELTPRAETVIHLDVAHRGLGTASCGPDTLPQYLVGPGTYDWTWSLTATGPHPA